MAKKIDLTKFKGLKTVCDSISLNNFRILKGGEELIKKLGVRDAP